MDNTATGNPVNEYPFCNHCHCSPCGCWPLPSVGQAAQKCPVCEGRGQVDGMFYRDGTGIAGWDQCRSCIGSGVIYVGG